MKSLNKVKPAIVAMGMVVLLSAAIGNAQARLASNGIDFQGVRLNGLSLNALSLNGLTYNAMNFNGRFFNALSLNGFPLNGVNLNQSMADGNPAQQVMSISVEMPGTSESKPSRISASNGHLVIEINR